MIEVDISRARCQRARLLTEKVSCKQLSPERNAPAPPRALGTRTFPPALFMALALTPKPKDLGLGRIEMLNLSNSSRRVRIHCHRSSWASRMDLYEVVPFSAADCSIPGTSQFKYTQLAINSKRFAITECRTVLQRVSVVTSRNSKALRNDFSRARQSHARNSFHALQPPFVP